jgi:hypothetical protein
MSLPGTAEQPTAVGWERGDGWRWEAAVGRGKEP